MAATGQGTRIFISGGEGVGRVTKPGLEIDPGQPRVAGAPLKSRLRHYANLEHMAPKLRHLVSEFAWGRMDVLAYRESQRLDAEAA